MSNILFFDTETTGLYNYRLPADHPSQPYIVQLAAQLRDDAGAVLSEFSFLVDNGLSVEIPEAASAVHGITTAKAHALGAAPNLVMAGFRHFYGNCALVCGHNLKFDLAVMETAIARYLGRVFPLKRETFCTMEAAAPIVNLPPTARMLAAGFNKPKAPKLEECIRHFFDEDLEGAHDAMIDVRACARVYYHLQTLAKAA